MPQPDQGLGQVPDVLLHTAGHVPGVRADHADLHGPLVPSGAVAGRRRVQVGGEHPLEHVPVLRVLGCPSSKTRASCWVIAATFSALVPAAGTGISSWMRAPQPSSLEPERHRHQRGAGLHRQGGGRGHPGLLAEEVDLDAAAVTSRSPTRQTRPPARSRWASTPNGLWPAGRRQHLHAEPLAEREERLGDRLGLQPLGHGGELAGPAGDDPRPGLLAVAHVRQGEDHAAAGLAGCRASPPPPRLDVHPGHDPLDGDHRQPEHLQPVPGVGAQRRAGQGPQLLAGHLRAARPAQHAAQVRLQHLDLGPCRRQAMSATAGRPTGPTTRAGGRPASSPADSAQPVQPLAQPLRRKDMAADPPQRSCWPAPDPRRRARAAR